MRGTGSIGREWGRRIVGCAAGLACTLGPVAAQEPADGIEPRTAGPASVVAPASGEDAPRGADRREAPGDSASAAGRTARTPGRVLLRGSDLPYAVAFFGSLALVEPLQGLDRRVASVADGNRAGPDHLLYSAGAWAGNLWIDLGAAAATFGLGQLTGGSRLARVGLRSLESLVAVDLLTTFFKVSVGRQRPEEPLDPDVFRPIAWNHDFASFPSGHASHAFALAATVSRELGGWTPWVAYPLAAGVGVSRVVGGHHWPTDIVAGAALGLFAARLTGRLHGPPARGREPALILVPGPGPGALLAATVPLR